MKMKRIMLITFLLFAVLTIGAVSAADDIASDNITASDDADVIAYDYDEDDDEYYGFDPNTNEEIPLDPDDEEAYITEISLPSEAKGYLEISNNNESIFKLNVNSDDDHWEEYEGELTGTVYIADIFDNLSKIKDGDNLTFKYYELKKGTPEIIDMFTVVCSVKLNNTHMTLTDANDEYEFEEVEVDYPIDFEDGVLMEGNWKETELILITVDDENFEGRVEIWINKTLKFNKALDDLDVNSDDEYVIYIKDLKINKEGTYLIECYIYDDNEVVKYNSTEEEDNLILSLYEPQIFEIDGVTININPLPTTITGNESFITIDSSASEDDTITIYVDEEEPITFKLNDTRRDESDNFIIGSKELNMNLTIGQHNINITYKGENITNQKINLKSNIEINFEDDIVYTGFDDEGFIFITLEDGEIEETKIEGKINVTIFDDDGNIIATYEEYIDDIINSQDPDIDARIIKTADMKNPTLNGTYTVIVRYFDGDEAATQAEGKVTFKTLTADDFGASINPIIKDENDTVISFKDVPLIENIKIEIDDIEINDDPYIDELNSQEGEYYIKYDKLEGLSDGTHKISVYLENGMDRIELASGEVYVDVIENIDPNLTITVKDIEEGDVANVVITTNETFTGNITVNVANKNHTVTITNGQGNITIPDLKANTYTATATFKANEIFNESIKTATFTVVKKIDPNLTISVANVVEGNAATVVITTNETFTGNITVQVANKNYTVNVVKGQGNISITGLKANTYTATALFKSSGIFEDSIKNATFKVTAKQVTPVKKPVIKLTLKKVKVKKSAKKLVLKATLKINGKAPKKGTKIKFTFKGKKYTGKTNTKGVAKVTIKKKVLKKLKVGKKVKYTAKYSTKTVKKTVKVKK